MKNPTPSATTKTLEEDVIDTALLDMYQMGIRLGQAKHPYDNKDLTFQNKDQAKAAINNYTTQAVIKELEAHISDLSYAVGYTDDQPFLKRQLELCKERLDELKRH